MSYRSRIAVAFAVLFSLLVVPVLATEGATKERAFVAYLDQLSERWRAQGPLQGEALQQAQLDVAELRGHALKVGLSDRAISRLDLLEAELLPREVRAKDDAPTGTIRGRVVAEAGAEPIPHISITLFRGQQYIRAVDSGPDGSYEAQVPPGRYFLIHHHSFTSKGWAAQRYRRLPCIPGDCNIQAGTPVDVGPGEVRSGIDFELKPAGRIVGSVTRAADGSPIEYGSLDIYDSEGRLRSYHQVIDGAYVSDGFFSGRYFALMRNTRTEVGQLFGAGPYCFVPSNTPCSLESGTPIEVVDAVDFRADFALRKGAFISGKIFGPNGEPLFSSASYSLKSLPAGVFFGEHQDSQNYRTPPLPPGNYALSARASGFPSQLYRDHVCVGPCLPEQADLIVLSEGSSLENVDFHLHRYGSLSGRVEDRTSGTPLANIEVHYFAAATGEQIGRVSTDAAGHFRLNQLAPGAYKLTAKDNYHEGRAYPDVPFLYGGEAAALTLAAPFVVPEADHLELPPLRLGQLGRIRGRVVDAESGLPVTTGPLQVGAISLADADSPNVSSLGPYDPADGSFEIRSLQPGRYVLLVDGFEGRDLLVGGTLPCAATTGSPPIFAHCDITRGTTFDVAIDAVAEAGEIRLPAAGRIAGNFRLLSGRRDYLAFDLVTADGHFLKHWQSGPQPVEQTDFSVDVPGGGTYFLKAYSRDHLVEVYSGIECTTPPTPEACLQTQLGTPIEVAPGETHGGVEIGLRLNHQPCFPYPNVFCLGGGRFAVGGYHVGNDGYEFSQGQSISNEAGYFTFFDPNNVEVVVKVLNACQEFGKIWVFAAGLTDVTNQFFVRDSWAAKTRFYEQRGSFKPIVDTVTFDTCAAPPPDPQAQIAATRAASTALEIPAPLPSTNSCGGDSATSLCLGGRFRVELEWETGAGLSGPGNSVPLTADTGFFYFFSPANIEVIVKVLNACNENLGRRFWVFAAGLTDVATTVRVTDTVTGAQKTYLRPLGQLFAPVLDLDAFATCP